MVTSGLVDAVAGVLVSIGSLVAMALIDPLLLGLTLLVVVLAAVVVIGLGGRIQKLTLQAQTQVGAAGRRRGPGHPGHPHHPGGRGHLARDRHPARPGRATRTAPGSGWPR